MENKDCLRNYGVLLSGETIAHVIIALEHSVLDKRMMLFEKLSLLMNKINLINLYVTLNPIRLFQI